MRRSNTTTTTTTTPQHHPPRTPSTLALATTSTTATTTTTTKTPASRPPHTNASPRVSLPPSSRPRRPASTIGTIDAPKRASSTVSTVSSTTSRASPRPFTSQPNRPPLLSSACSVNASATPRLALRARDRNAALSSRPATPRFLKPPLPPPAPRSTLSTLSALSSFSSPSPSPSLSPSSPTMGYDKDTPRKPTLASRPFTRAPLTPKIAASSSTLSSTRTPANSNSANYSANSATSPYQTVTVSTPLARRVTGLSSATSSSNSHYHSGNNDTTSPAAVPSYLNNITPRSGARQSRVDGGSTTPTGTPNGHGFGLGIGVGGAGSTSASSSADPDSKFFYASEAKSSVSVAASASASASAPHITPSLGMPMASPSLAATPSGRPASTFFYANGKSLPPANPHPSASASTSALPAHIPPPMASPTLLSSVTTPGAQASKFVHANGAALERKLSSSSSTRRAAPATPTTAQQQASARPLSPVKMAAVSPYPLQKSLSFPVVAPTSSASSSVNGSTNNPTNHRPSVPGTLSLNAAATAVGTAPLVASPGPVSPGSVRLDVLSRQRSNFSASIGSIGSIGSNSSAGGGHSRQGSLTMADPPTVARLLQHSSQPSSEAPSPASGQFPAYPFPSVSSPGGAPATNNAANAAATSGLAAILQAADDLAEDGAEGSEGADHHEEDATGFDEHDDGKEQDSRRSSTNSSASAAASPAHTHSQVDELVTMARRERKVQDLEITNASLEAINRSLERQLRKQKNELRQFRRLSRSGRLSLAPSTTPGGAVGGGAVNGGSSRITSSSTVEGPMQDMDQLLRGDGDEDDSFLDEFDDYASDMEVSFNEDDDDDDNEDDSDSYSDGDTRRKRDERRLQLDLAQHRQLLVDSQKINQSIKRCMNWTEALIQEGQKALAFQVRVSEVQLGGRVLAADEVEEREQREHPDPSERSERLLKESELLLEEDHDGHDERSEAIHEDEQSEVIKDEAADPAKAAEDALADAAPVSANSTTANTPTTSAAASTSASSSTDDHDHASRDEAFSPISHNVRTVRFDTGDSEAKKKTDAPVNIDIPSLDGVAAAPISEASPVDAVPATPSKQPPTDTAVDNTAPILASPTTPTPTQEDIVAPLDVTPTPTAAAATATTA